MIIKELSILEFKDFSENHFLGNFHQTIEYAMLKSEEGYDYELIGYVDNDITLAASLILYKKIGNYNYGYAPRGFLIDYTNTQLLNNFTRDLKDYYKKKNFAFIKINPEIAIGELNKNTLNVEYNSNYSIIDNLIKSGYNKLKSNLNFESLLPRMNAIINIDSFNSKQLNKNTRNKIKKGLRKGLYLEQSEQKDLDTFYNFIKNKILKDEFYYKDLYNTFSKTDSVDLFLVKVDFKEYLINSQNYYNYETSINNKLIEKMIEKNHKKTINAKMNSDKALLAYKNDIAEASKYINTDKELILAGAIVIKYQNRVTIQISGFDKRLQRYSPNYFLYYSIINYYKGKYKYMDLNGITADLSKDNKYYGLNKFKLGFNPQIYEYIGEFDLVTNDNSYNHLLKSGLLAKEFNKG